MSKEGIKIAAELFNRMQVDREKLFRLATAVSPVDHQDTLLAQLFARGNDLLKDDFCAIVAGNFPGDHLASQREIKQK